MEDVPGPIRHPAKATGTAGRLRGGKTVPILSDLGRNEFQRRDVYKRMGVNLSVGDPHLPSQSHLTDLVTSYECPLR